MNTKFNHESITREMSIAAAISPIIKLLLLDRDERALAMCHKIHRVVRTPCVERSFTAVGLRVHPGWW